MNRSLRDSVVALLATLSSVASHGEPLRPAPRGGEQVYRQVCALCHEQRIGPPLLGRAWPAPAIEAMVRNGRGAMPAFRHTEITPHELRELAVFIEDHARTAP